MGMPGLARPGEAQLKMEQAGPGQEQVLQQVAYPAIWPPIDAHDLAIPAAIPPNLRKPV